MKRKILTIIGARPQFIKCSPVSRKLRINNTEILVHTGQHFSKNMSEVFFKELKIPVPDYNLNINGGSHAEMTSLMMKKLEKVIVSEKPDIIIIYGDTTSTLAGALVSSKLNIPLAHIEAGLRSFNKNMPEEINRIIADHCSDLLFCPTTESINNLKDENIFRNLYLTGDVMKDSIVENVERIKNIKYLQKFTVNNNENYYFITVHRQDNTDNFINLKNIVRILNNIKCKVIFPIHPRTSKVFKKLNVKFNSNIKILNPVSYIESLWLQKNAKLVVTDSGGIQKEAYILNKNCITLRNETEWIETIEDKFNILVGTDIHKFKKAEEYYLRNPARKNINSKHYGNGKASEKIANKIEEYLFKKL